MRKNVLISLLAVTGAPIAALADADVVFVKAEYPNDKNLEVSDDGDLVTVAKSKTTKIKKSLLPGKYYLQVTSSNNAKITVTYNKKEYELKKEFEITGDKEVEVTINVGYSDKSKVTTFSGLKFVLKYDFDAVVADIATQLAGIINKPSDDFKASKDWKTSLEQKASDLAAKIQVFKEQSTSYQAYKDYNLWKYEDASKSPEFQALANEISNFGTSVNNAAENFEGNKKAEEAYEAASNAFKTFTENEWKNASSYATGLDEIKIAYNDIEKKIADFKTEYETAYKNGTAKDVDSDKFTSEVNTLIDNLKKAIVKADGDNTSFTNINNAYVAAQKAFNDATAQINEVMPVDGIYKDWNDAALIEIREAWKQISDAYKTVEKDKTLAKDKETEIIDLITKEQTEIENTKTVYINKHTQAEKSYKKAQEEINKLTADFNSAKNNPDVQKDFSKEITWISDAIDALTNKVETDHNAPHNILTANYEADVKDIQEKINALKADAADIIKNYDIYTELVAKLGDTGLKKELADAEAAVKAMKPADKNESYDAAAKFDATAKELEATITEIEKNLTEAYNKRTLSDVTRVKYDNNITETSGAIAKYKNDADKAVKCFDEVKAAIKNYKAKLKTLTSTVGVNTAIVKTISTTVAGPTYGECMNQLNAKISKIESALDEANKKLDAEHLEALTAIKLDETIVNDAEILTNAFETDKKNSEDTAKLNAAKTMYNAANDLIGGVKTRIDAHRTDWKAGNEDGQLGLKYEELTKELDKIEGDINEQAIKITNVAANADAITADKAVEAMALLSVIKDDVDKINNSLSTLEGKADKQIELVKAENKAKAEVDEAIEKVEKALTDAETAFEVDGENIDKQIEDIQKKIKTVADDAQAERDKENLQVARKDSKDKDNKLVKGIDSRIAELQEEADNLLKLAKDSTANFKAYTNLKDIYAKQNVEIGDNEYIGYTNIFAKVRELIEENTNGTNATYYKSMLDGPDGKYFKESQDILEAINKAYKAGTAIAQTEALTSRMKALSNNVLKLPTSAKNDFDANERLKKEGEEVMTRWNDINNKYNASDLTSETLKPLLAELAQILKEINDEQKVVETYYANGESDAKESLAKEVYRKINEELNKKEAFINGDEYNEAIANDNQKRWEQFLTAYKNTKAEYGKATKMIEDYQKVSTEELRKLVNITTIIEAQDNIYKYLTLYTNLYEEADKNRNETKSPDLWDINGTYAKTANDYTEQLKAAEKELDTKVNTEVRKVLDKKLAALNDQLSTAQAKVATYDKNVQEKAFKDVVEFYNKLNATSYKDNPFLINNLDSDWKTFSEIEGMLTADLENAAQSEWKAMYEGEYVGVDGTLTENDDRYAGAKNDNEKWYTALKGFAYDGAKDDVKAYEEIVKNTLDKAVVTADAAVKANNMFKDIETVRGNINDFYNQARSEYNYAKAKADKYEGNLDAYDKLTFRYDSIASEIDAAKKYYEALNIADASVEGNIKNAYSKVNRWKEALKLQNASVKLKYWDAYNAEISGNILNIYTTSNNDEIAVIKAEIQNVKEEKEEAVKKFYGDNTEMIKTIEEYYKNNCEGLEKELNDLLKAFADNNTSESAKKDAGLLALEKKVAKAHTGLTNLWKTDLIAAVIANLNQLVADAEEDYTAAYAVYGKTHKPVQKDNKATFEACRTALDNVKTLIDSYGDDIMTYDTKVIHIVENVVNDIKAARAKVEAEDVPYIAHEKALNELKALNEQAIAEYDRVKAVVEGYKHITMTRNNGGTWQDYYNTFFDAANTAIETNKTFLENANDVLENGPVTKVISNSDKNSFKQQVAYAELDLAQVEALSTYNETFAIYTPAVSQAYNTLVSTFNNKNKSIYDKDGELYDTYYKLSARVNNFSNYTDETNFDWSYISNGYIFLTPSKDINGNAWLDAEGNVISHDPINYVKDEELGAKLVFATADKLVEEMNALTASAEENTYEIGDVNHDGEILSDDYMTVIKATLNPEELTEGKDFAAADVNTDGKITIADVTMIAAKVSTGEWPNNSVTRNAPMATAETMNVSAENNNGMQRIAINLNNRKDYVACQMDITLPAGMTVVAEGVGDRANGHALYSNDVNGVHRIVVSTIENNSFNNGNAILYLDVQGGNVDKIALSNIIFAEANGKATTIVDGETTGINGVEAESSLRQKIYSVGGQLLNKVKQGINIIRNANGSTKKVSRN